ncbi:hypothetical protein Sango_2083300 [Sesamum angolense]|uniref:FAF domain-containing protein n=1 Tax=Sesamum angolense TaxID=2727404 RepID=A0AAE2BLX8_9LAMI|nr:hypothetical protein Sango_2083300 [Sesamum angolense]
MHNPELGDYIGVESCVDLKPDLADGWPWHGGAARAVTRRRRRREVVEKEYPPPIPALVRTENLPSHMPWVMKRYYTSDGRLVIKEEKVKRHEYFEAYRSNGRLVLNLVPLGDVAEETCSAGELAAEFLDDMAAPDEEISGGDKQGVSDPTVVKEIPDCYKYTGTAINPCGGFGVATAAAPPLRPPVRT